MRYRRATSSDNEPARQRLAMAGIEIPGSWVAYIQSTDVTICEARKSDSDEWPIVGVMVMTYRSRNGIVSVDATVAHDDLSQGALQKVIKAEVCKRARMLNGPEVTITFRPDKWDLSRVYKVKNQHDSAQAGPRRS